MERVVEVRPEIKDLFANVFKYDGDLTLTTSRRGAEMGLAPARGPGSGDRAAVRHFAIHGRNGGNPVSQGHLQYSRSAWDLRP